MERGEDAIGGVMHRLLGVYARYGREWRILGTEEFVEKTRMVGEIGKGAKARLKHRSTPNLTALVRAVTKVTQSTLDGIFKSAEEEANSNNGKGGNNNNGWVRS